jgi:hypothetical protein
MEGKEKEKQMIENGNICKGNFLSKVKEGKGKYIWSPNGLHSGTFYEGDWKDGRMEGKGKEFFPNGNSFDGDFINNRFDGKGKFRWSGSGPQAGRIYIGDFKAGKRDGKGKEILANGDIYQGDFKDDYWNGKGVYTYSKRGSNGGRSYCGYWKGGKREGKGKEIFCNGDRYEGDFINDKYEGKGKLIWSGNRREGKNVYRGGFKKGMKHGVGIYSFSCGVIILCEYYYGRHIRLVSKDEIFRIFNPYRSYI